MKIYSYLYLFKQCIQAIGFIYVMENISNGNRNCLQVLNFMYFLQYRKAQGLSFSQIGSRWSKQNMKTFEFFRRPTLTTCSNFRTLCVYPGYFLHYRCSTPFCWHNLSLCIIKQVEPTNAYRKKPRNDELRFCTFGSGQLTFICRIVCYLHTEHISFYRLVSICEE